MDFKDAIDLFQNHYSEVDTLWSYFGTISTAVFGFIIGNDSASRSYKTAFMVAAGYLLFCIGNFAALANGQEQLLHYYDYALTLRVDGLKLVRPVSLREVSAFYWAMAGMVCIGVFAVTRIKSTG